MAVSTPTVLHTEQLTLSSGTAASTSFTPSGGTNTLLIVEVFGGDFTANAGSASLSTDGAGTIIDGQATPFLGFGATAWRWMGNTASPQTVTIDFGVVDGREVFLRVIEYTGVNATTPTDTPVSAGGDDVASVSPSVSSETGDRVHGLIFTQADPTPEQTGIGTDTQIATTGRWSSSQQAAGAASVSMGWTGLSGQSAYITFNINASATSTVGWAASFSVPVSSDGP